MKKIAIFCLAAAKGLLAYNIADSFQYPVEKSEGILTPNGARGWFVAQDFQDCRKAAVPSGISACRHLGEDWNYYDGSDYSNANRDVLAIGNGYIVTSGVRRGFAGYIIMKHYLDSSDSSKYVLSIYAHLQTHNLPQAGQYFEKGQLIAHIATKAEMKKWTTFGPHLHLEIRKSKSITHLKDTFLNDGYDYSKGRYYDPTDVPVYNYQNPYGSIVLSTDWNREPGFIEHYKPNVSNMTPIIDGSGSLVRPDIPNKNNCRWGCYKDEAIMQPHDYSQSAVTFQWKSTSTCSRIKLGVITNDDNLRRRDEWIDPNNHMKVLVYEKNWKSITANKVFITTLPKTVKKLNSISWHNLAVVSLSKLNKPVEIVAECADYDDYKNVQGLGKSSLHLPLSYVFAGQSSIIRGSNPNYNLQPDGIYKDVAIGSEKTKAFTLFQWQTAPNCKQIMLKSGFYPDSYGYDANVNYVNIKPWNQKNWNDAGCSNRLPCIIDAPDGGEKHYYIIKIKTNPSAFHKNAISATCINK